MKDILSITTNSEKETMMVGEKLSKFAQKGDVFTLVGDLGAGKTHFVKGFVKGLGSDELVTSPTFTLLNVYEKGRLNVYHFDMYRLSSKEEGEELGFNEYFDPDNVDGVVLVEWPEQVEGMINCPRLQIKITRIDDNKREIVVSHIGGKE